MDDSSVYIDTVFGNICVRGSFITSKIFHPVYNGLISISIFDICVTVGIKITIDLDRVFFIRINIHIYA